MSARLVNILIFHWKCVILQKIRNTMGEDNILDFGPIEDKMQGIIKVIGVGGGGCNAVRNMYNDQIQGVTYAVCNTDSQFLSRSPVPVKLMLGQSGLGATDHGDGSPDHSRLATTDHENRPHDPKQQTIVEKWKGWLNSLMKDVTE